MCIAFVCVVIYLPKSYMPKDYHEIDGVEHKLTDEDRETIKFYLILFSVLVGLFVSWLQYYFYRVAKKWSTMEEKLLTH